MVGLHTHRAGPVQSQYYDLHGHLSDGREGVDEAGFGLGHAGLT